MAENTKEQIKAQKTISELLTEIGEKAKEIQKTFEKQRDAAKDVESVITAQKTKLESFEKTRDAANEVLIKAQEKRIDLEKEFMHAIRDGNLEQSYAIEEKIKLAQAEIDKAEELNEIAQEAVDLARTKLKVQKNIKDRVQGQADAAKKLGDNINSFFNSLPGGSFLTKAFGIDKLGDDLEKGVIDNLDKVDEGSTALGTSLGGVFTGLTAGVKRLGAAFAANPILFIAGIALAATKAFFAFKKEVRDIGNDLGVTAGKAQSMLVSLKLAETQLKFQGFDSAKLKTTLTEMSNTFGSLENVTVENAKNIEKMAQEMGIAGQDVVKFSKVMMDLTGDSFDTATSVAKMAANMAEAANVSTDKVMKDMQTSAEKFAEYSMQGAEGMAQAAIEAAKVGSELKSILEAADSLLKFETSITSQFEAQVLTGKMINTERARQLALDGDIAGLTTEIQSIVGGIGDIQELNVIQRKSVADAIGISVQDLMRISRGEQMQERQSVQETLNTNFEKQNKLLMEGLDIDKEQLEVSKDKNFNIQQKLY